MKRATVNIYALNRVLEGAIKARGISQREAAKDIGVGASGLTRLKYEQSPDLDGYASICAWLGVSLDTFAEEK